MKNTISQVFNSGKFVAGFTIFVSLLLFVTLYPLANPGDPLKQIGLGTFFEPGTYVNVYDAVEAEPNIMDIEGAGENRLYANLSDEDRIEMLVWFEAIEVSIAGLDLNDTETLLSMWDEHYDSTLKPKGMTKAKRNYFKRLDAALDKALAGDEKVVASKDEEGVLEETGVIADSSYVNVKDVPNVVRLPLGTDNFGRDVLKELVSAIRTSLLIGVIAGLIATFIGLTLGLLAGYLGGIIDDIIMFITNIFTVIPGFILLILISYSINQDQRGAVMVAIVIGMTSWVWTTRAVRSQVISLRNRDHVNLSKLSGHSLFRIITMDILPYIASYVVMALILQISSAILAEAQLSLLGLGPKTTEVPTLGLMMNWSMLYSAHLNGSWWAYFPVIMTIALISFSLNLMNTGLDQVFNPTLRD